MVTLINEHFSRGQIALCAFHSFLVRVSRGVGGGSGEVDSAERRRAFSKADASFVEETE